MEAALAILVLNNMAINMYINKISSKPLAVLHYIEFLNVFFEGLGYNDERPLEFEKEDLQELSNRCEKVLNDHSLAEELLPEYNGSNYGEKYFNDVEKILDLCKSILNEPFNDGEYLEFDIWY